jgi:hypothetical protein
MHIEARAASDKEKLNIDVEAETLPAGVVVFDDCEWTCQIFMAFDPGDWVIEITDPQNILKAQQTGLFHVHIHDEGDGGFHKKQ